MGYDDCTGILNGTTRTYNLGLMLQRAPGNQGPFLFAIIPAKGIVDMIYKE